MGTIADSVLAHGGKVTGIIPKILVDWERQHLGLTELIVSDDMHIRKKTIYGMCDGALILPGGYGTLDELFEIITWNQLSIHDKQLFLLNTDGFYDHLISHIDKMREEEFLYEKVSHSLKVVTDPSELVTYFKD